MARMQGVEPHEAGWLTRLVYWFVKRALYKVTGKARVPEPIKITAHSQTLAGGRPNGTRTSSRDLGTGGAQGSCGDQSRDHLMPGAALY